MTSAGLAWLTGSNQGSATLGGNEKKLGLSGSYSTPHIYATSPNLEAYKASHTFAGPTSYTSPVQERYKESLSYNKQENIPSMSYTTNTYSSTLPYSTANYQSIPQGYLSTESVSKPEEGYSTKFANTITLGETPNKSVSNLNLPQNYLEITPQPTSGRLVTSGYYTDLGIKNNYLSPNSFFTRDINAKSVTNSKVLGDDQETRLIQEASKRGRIYMSTPAPVNQLRQSVLTPYRNTLYREFDEVVEDLPDRTNLLNVINQTLRKSTVREKLLTSPTRVSIVRPSTLHPAKIDVETPLIEKYEDGSLYEGEANKKRQRHGRGVVIFTDGKRLEGEFKDGKIEGFATLYNKVGTVNYEGNFKNDQFHGQGTLHNENPQATEEQYDFKDFNKLGNNWKRYEGDFRQGKKQGVGNLHLANGERYYGEFKDDKVSGKGCFYLKDEPNGIAGEWKNGVFAEQF